MLWYSAPTSLNNDMRIDGVILEEYNKDVNMAMLWAIDLPFWRGHTPRSGLLGTQRLAVDLGEWLEEPAWEMPGWDLGGRPDPLLENEDDGQDIEHEQTPMGRVASGT